MNKDQLKNILVLCTGNSCRSQIAEGFLRKQLGPDFRVYSAGIEAHGVNPNAVKTMKEAGIDISNQTSNVMDDYKDIEFDFVLTVCDNAKENCPFHPAKIKMFHHNFPDPAKATGSAKEIEFAFGHTRNLIENYVTSIVSIISAPANHHKS